MFVGGPDADRERAVRERIEPHPGRAPPRYAGSRPSRPGAFAPSVSRMGLRIAFWRASACASPRCQGRAYASWRASSLACARALMARVFAHHPLPRSGRVGCAGTLMASNIVPRRCRRAPHRSQGAPRVMRRLRDGPYLRVGAKMRRRRPSPLARGGSRVDEARIVVSHPFGAVSRTASKLHKIRSNMHNDSAPQGRVGAWRPRRFPYIARFGKARARAAQMHGISRCFTSRIDSRTCW